MLCWVYSGRTKSVQNTWHKGFEIRKWHHSALGGSCLLPGHGVDAPEFPLPQCLCHFSPRHHVSEQWINKYTPVSAGGNNTCWTGGLIGKLVESKRIWKKYEESWKLKSLMQHLTSANLNICDFCLPFSQIFLPLRPDSPVRVGAFLYHWLIYFSAPGQGSGGERRRRSRRRRGFNSSIRNHDVAWEPWVLL